MIHRMGRREGDTLGSEQESRKQARVFGTGSAPLAAGVLGQLGLNFGPGLSINDGFMLSIVASTLVWNATDINRIGKNAVEVSAAERGSPRLPSIEHGAQLGL